MLFFFIYTSFELVKILVEWSNQSKNMNLESPSPRAKAPSAKRGRRPGDEHDAVLVTISFRRSCEKRLCVILQIWCVGSLWALDGLESIEIPGLPLLCGFKNNYILFSEISIVRKDSAICFWNQKNISFECTLIHTFHFAPKTFATFCIFWSIKYSIIHVRVYFDFDLKLW